jgi:hypothetical protein
MQSIRNRTRALHSDRKLFRAAYQKRNGLTSISIFGALPVLFAPIASLREVRGSLATRKTCIALAEIRRDLIPLLIYGTVSRGLNSSAEDMPMRSRGNPLCAFEWRVSE